MLKSSLELSVRCASDRRSSKLLYCITRNLCSISKPRRKRTSKVSTCNASKVEFNSVGSLSTDTAGSVRLPDNGELKSTDSSNLIDKSISLPKNTKQATKTPTEAGNKSETVRKKRIKIDLDSSEVICNKIQNLKLNDRYGEAINRPGMKPFSSLKKKESNSPKDSKENRVNDNPIGKVQSKTGKEINIVNECIDITQKIPKIRSPSFRLEQKLLVPSNWDQMRESDIPSTKFLDNILNFSIMGLQKSTTISEKSQEYVKCFVTEDKTSAKIVPAVTTVLSKTMTATQAFALNLWRKRMTQQLGEEGFQQHKTDILTRGKQFHDTIQRYLHGDPVSSLNIENLPLITGCWKSLVPVLNSIDDVIAVESEVLHPQLMYRGIIDCIVEIKGQPFIVEWKHSLRKRESLQKNYDSPVQLMAYTGAINANESYPFGVKNSLLIVAYEDGSPADVFLLSVPENGEHHWKTWLKRLHSYWSLQKAAKEIPEKS